MTFTLIMDDPDAPGPAAWTHWVLFDLPASQRSLPENLPTTAQLASGAIQGPTDFGTPGYGGPCPPPGPAHTYRFILYAVSGSLGLPASATKLQVLAALEGRILAQSLLTGTFGR